jgi:hypothetical protein
VKEHDFEPIKGLPEALPQGEHILWQGEPAFWPLAVRALHVRLVLAYFALLFVWSLGVDLLAGVAVGEALLTAVRLVPVALAAAGLLALYAWFAHRCTVYTITNRRVVMRYGVALPMTLNLPFAVVESAALRTYRDGTGDIPLVLTEKDRMSYFALWPNARPWRTAKPQPMLRSVPDAAKVAEILGAALADAATDRGTQQTHVSFATGSNASARRHAPAAA